MPSQTLTVAEPPSDEIRRALERGEFVLDYQPVVEVRTGRVAGFEALVRWRHPVAGLLGPERFIRRCEEDGLILDLGRWILGEACRQRARWREAGIVDGPIAVNVSPVELADERYVDQVLETLDASGLPPQHLDLEITESALVASFERVRDAIVALRRHRIGVALDDFGTGYSFLRSLRSFGVDKLKIPIEFICGLGEDPDCDAILDAILALGHRLGHSIVAEGVETPEQLALLRGRGCDLAQGNFLCPPSAADAVVRWLDRGGLAATLRAAPQRRGGGEPGARSSLLAERRIRVVIVDDQDLARRTIRRVLEQAEDVELVGEALDGQAAIDLVRDVTVDVVLLDVSMPGMGGLETLRELKAMRPTLPVLVLSMHQEDPYAVRFLGDGAHGYMMKERAAEELIGALRTVHAGRRYVSQALLDQLVRFASRRGSR